MVIFHGYVSLPEGILEIYWKYIGDIQPPIMGFSWGFMGSNEV
jgi:hypothetical protein